jgi:hypothetical protein
MVPLGHKQNDIKDLSGIDVIFEEKKAIKGKRYGSIYIVFGACGQKISTLYPQRPLHASPM